MYGLVYAIAWFSSSMLSRRWRQTISSLPHRPPSSLPALRLNKYFEPIHFLKIKTQQVYWLLVKTQCHIHKVEPSCKAKWNSIFDIEANEWASIFTSPFFTCRSTKLQSFQYRLLHRTITCNHWLFKVKIKDSPLCDWCKEDDTIEHFFYIVTML